MNSNCENNKKTNFVQDMSTFFMDKVRYNSTVAGKDKFKQQAVMALEDEKIKVCTGTSLDCLEIIYDARTIENVKKAISGNRGIWKENLQRSQEILLDYLQKTDNEEGKQYAANSLLDISERLIAVGQEDLKKFEGNSENKYLRFAQRIYNNLDLIEKKKFWMDVYGLQQKTLGTIANSNVDHDTQMKALKSLVKYCNIFINGLDSEQKDSLLDVKNERREAIVKLRDLRMQNLEKECKEDHKPNIKKLKENKTYDREYALIQM